MPMHFNCCSDYLVRQGVQLITKGLLNKAEVYPDGTVVRLKVPASEEQIQSVFDFVAAYFGVGKPK